MIRSCSCDKYLETVDLVILVSFRVTQKTGWKYIRFIKDYHDDGIDMDKNSMQTTVLKFFSTSTLKNS